MAYLEDFQCSKGSYEDHSEVRHEKVQGKRTSRQMHARKPKHSKEYLTSGPSQ